MKSEEFLEIYRDLHAAFPEYYNKTRAKSMSETLKSMPADWFKEKAKIVLNGSEPKFNWGGEVHSYYRAKAQEDRTKKLFEEMDQANANCTDEGLSKHLKAVGAKSLMDAIKIETQKRRGA